MGASDMFTGVLNSIADNVKNSTDLEFWAVPSFCLVFVFLGGVYYFGTYYRHQILVNKQIV